MSRASSSKESGADHGGEKTAEGSGKPNIGSPAGPPTDGSLLDDVQEVLSDADDVSGEQSPRNPDVSEEAEPYDPKPMKAIGFFPYGRAGI